MEYCWTRTCICVEAIGILRFKGKTSSHDSTFSLISCQFRAWSFLVVVLVDKDPMTPLDEMIFWGNY